MSRGARLRRRRARDKRELQKVMDWEGLTQAALALRAGVSRQTVTATLSGARHNACVLDALRGMGAKEKHLADPHSDDGARA